MRTLVSLTVLLACVLLLALPASAALANAADDRIVHDCQSSPNGELTGSYTKAQLLHAQNNLPVDVNEYTGCYDAIQQALTAPGGGSHGGGGSGGTGGSGGGGTGGGGGAGTSAGAGGGTAPVTVAAAPADAARPQVLAGAAIVPGTLPTIGRDAHALPTALLVPLVLLAVAALAAATLTFGRRVVARRRA